MLVSKKLSFILEQNEQKKLSHAFLIETNNVEECYKDIKFLIKNINCPHTYSEKCDKECNLCRLIDNNNLPSFITVEPDGMSIKRDQINDLITLFGTKPIFSNYNCYVILNAETLNATSSNILLKFLEEPSENVVSFFVTTNLKQILPTIKSRCEVVTANYDNDTTINEDLIKIADKYLSEVLHGNDYLVNKKYILSNELERKDIQDIFLYYFDKYKKILENQLQNNEDNSKVLEIINLIEKELKYLQYNVNLELILDDFVIEMRRTHE